MVFYRPLLIDSLLEWLGSLGLCLGSANLPSIPTASGTHSVSFIQSWQVTLPLEWPADSQIQLSLTSLSSFLPKWSLCNIHLLRTCHKIPFLYLLSLVMSLELIPQWDIPSALYSFFFYCLTIKAATKVILPQNQSKKAMNWLKTHLWFSMNCD